MSKDSKARKKLDQIIDKARKSARKAEKAAARAEKALCKIKDAKSKIRSDVKGIKKKNRKLGKRMKSYIKEQSDKAVKRKKVKKKVRKLQG